MRRIHQQHSQMEVNKRTFTYKYLKNENNAIKFVLNANTIKKKKLLN